MSEQPTTCESKIGARVLAPLLLLAISCASNNPLLGYWSVDQSRTVAELEKTVGAADLSKWVECYKKGLCGNYSIYFGPNEYCYLYPSGEHKYFRTVSQKYKVTKDGNRITLNRNDKGKALIFKLTLSKDGYFVELNGFREYLVRVDREEIEKQIVNLEDNKGGG